MRESLRQQIVSVLSDDSELNGLVSDAIYHERPPGGLALPVLVYRFVSQRRDEALEGGGKYVARMEVGAYASDLADAEEIAAVALAILADEGESGGLDTATERVVRCSSEGMDMKFPDFADQDSPVFEVRGKAEMVFFDVES